MPDTTIAQTTSKHVETATGKTPSALLWGVGGTVAVALLTPILARWLPGWTAILIGLAIAVAVAFMARKGSGLQSAGQTAALVTFGCAVAHFLSPLIQRGITSVMGGAKNLMSGTSHGATPSGVVI